MVSHSSHILRVTKASKTGDSSPIMKFSIVLVAVLSINGALAKPKAQGPGPVGLSDPGPVGPGLMDPVGSGPPPGITYMIQATKISTSPQSEDVVSFNGDTQEGQNLTIHYIFDLVEPLFVKAELSNSDADFSYKVNDMDSINACTPGMYSNWEQLISSLVSVSLSPPFICPLPPGCYICLTEAPPFPATFSQPIPCGDYTLSTDFFRKETGFLHAEYGFTIEDDGTCYNPGDEDHSSHNQNDSSDNDDDSSDNDDDSSDNDDDSSDNADDSSDSDDSSSDDADSQ